MEAKDAKRPADQQLLDSLTALLRTTRRETVEARADAQGVAITLRFRKGELSSASLRRIASAVVDFAV